MEYHLAKNYLNSEKVERKKMREGAGIGLAEIGAEKEDVVLITADTTGSSKANFFAEKFPERHIQVGVAEQNMIGVAAGLAYEGKVPFAITYAAFLTGRAWEPIRTTLAYPENHAVLVSSHAGLATGPDGPTHQMTEDISIMRSIPNFTVICPCDYEQARAAVKAAYSAKGPVYIRNARPDTPVFTTGKTPFEIGKAQVLRGGSDITVIGHGYVVHDLLLIAEEMKRELSIEVINLHTIKPIDKKTIVDSAKKTERVFCVEDHNIMGGAGSAVAELLGQQHPTKIKLHGVLDTFAESGSPKDLWAKYKLDTEGIKKEILEFLKD